MKLSIQRASLTAIAAALVLFSGCATRNQSASTTSVAGASTAGTAGTAAAPAGKERIVKSRDGRFDGVIVGTPRSGSKFAQLQIGMEMSEVQRLIGAPDRWHTHESGKRWIPFYFGNDVRRLQAMWNNEGCLAFTGGNQFGGGGNELVRIEVDPTVACYQP